MEFAIEMRIMKPGIKLKGIEAHSIWDAKDHIISIILDYCMPDSPEFRIAPIITTSDYIEFRLFFAGRRVKIALCDARHRYKLKRQNGF
jgi:hypothetical protein